MNRVVLVEWLALSLCEKKEERREEFAAMAAQEMIGAVSLSVPLDVSIGTAVNWAEAH